ncbi:putative NLR family CARD domain-containing protein 4 [Apostichopus japonicus]|uniref:Putative NLR family CARD domain-containing protein 4 n=1 Tax=Stichopus japonicus TaxID=307972 RepID=A0A2G8KIJ7_STIJA|nr:putative NLR family CARD domain-containing protein 4 [Apostichopus japonicus]
MADVKISDGKYTRFKTGLKIHYESLYSTVQPVPCIGGKRYHVNDLYQSVGVVYLKTNRPAYRGPLWDRLESYHSILNDERVKSGKRIIEAPQGYGKTILALQFAFDWCKQVKDSPMKDVDIFIFVQVKKLSYVKSFPKLVKRMFFQQDSKITEKNVHNILLTSKSVLLLVDVGSEDIGNYIKEGSDLDRIIQGEVYPNFEVILMTRPLSLELEPQVKRLKLIGFDKRAQENYISKSLTEDNQAKLEKTKKIILDNPVLGDLCKVPLLFAVFSHLGHGNDNISNFTTLTNFFNEIIKSFHQQFRKHGALSEQFKHMDLFEGAHLKLNKMAFDRLVEDNDNAEWELDEINSLLGRNFIEKYLKTGILQLDEHILVELDSTSDGMQYEKTIRFYHNILTEWYAAHYLVESVHKADELKEELQEGYVFDVLDNFEPSQVQCLYRFACGINSAAAKHIINYLQEYEDNVQFSMLCRVEQTGSVDGILQNIKEMFAREFQVHDRDSAFGQRTYIQLMEIAAREKICISRLYLNETFNTVCMYTGDIILNTHVRLPPLQTLESIWIERSRVYFLDEDVDGVFFYVSNCPNIKIIYFGNCFLPRSIKESPNLAILRERNVAVHWFPSVNWYYLNLTSRTWERNSARNPLVDRDYDREKADFDVLLKL